MNKVLFIIALSSGMAACSSDSVRDSIDNATEEASGSGDNSAEIERLGYERSAFYEKQVEAMGAGDMDASDRYKVSMDSVDALYMKAIKR